MSADNNGMKLERRQMFSFYSIYCKFHILRDSQFRFLVSNRENLRSRSPIFFCNFKWFKTVWKIRAKSARVASREITQKVIPRLSFGIYSNRFAPFDQHRPLWLTYVTVGPVPTRVTLAGVLCRGGPVTDAIDAGVAGTYI